MAAKKENFVASKEFTKYNSLKMADDERDCGFDPNNVGVPYGEY